MLRLAIDAFQSGMRAAGVPTAAGLDTRQASGAVDAGGAPYPASEADAKALAELDERAAADKQVLLSWALDAWTLEDAEVSRLFSSMLHALNLLRRFRISPTAFEAFMSDVACRYNSNPCVSRSARACFYLGCMHAPDANARVC